MALDQQRVTDRIKDSMEAERLRLLDLVKTLELKFNSVEQVIYSLTYEHNFLFYYSRLKVQFNFAKTNIQSSSEEQWTMRQQRSSLEAEKVAFEREKEFIREKQLADESRIQVATLLHIHRKMRWFTMDWQRLGALYIV